MTTFGSILRTAITEQKLTLQRVADATKTKKGYISGICNRKVNPPSAKMIRRLCKVLDLDEQEMLARATFEKFPKGLAYVAVEEIITEAKAAGQFEAPGSVT